MRHRARGFTLVEAVIVIAIAGIVSAIVAVFIKRPVEGYFDANRRAELTDAADTALRRLARDLRLALPNSIRVDPTGRFIEFLLTTGGGRYRAEVTSAGTGNTLDFVTAAGDTSFDVIGTMPTISAGNHIVVFNLGSGFTGSDAWQAGANNRATVASATATTVTLTSAKLFPLESPASRFHVVEHAVTYACDLSSGVLRRHWNYGIAAAQATPPTGGSNALLATRVTGCAFAYDSNELLARYGIVTANLAMTIEGETVTLQAQVHVSNTP
jgi:MSHA biogenesis protein MshO